MAYRPASGYFLDTDTIFRWIDFVLLILFFLVCTGKKRFVFPDIASIQLWEGIVLALLVSCWQYIFSFMHTERSSTLYEAWKDIIIRNCVAVTLGWGFTLFCLLLIKESILVFDLPEKERHFLYFSNIQSAFVWLGLLLLLFLLYRIAAALVLRKKNLHQPLSYALIVGLNVRSLALAKNLRSGASGYELVGFADALSEEDIQLYGAALDVVCSLQGLEEYIRTHRVDELFLTLPVRSFYDEMKNIIQYAVDRGLVVRVLNDLFTFETGSFHYIDGDLSHFTADSPLPGRKERIQIGFKCLAEKIIALCALIFFTPLFFAVWVLNFFHWPFSLKEYIGCSQQPFRMVQFKDIQTIPFLQKKWLRNIPRLINIFLGDMSMIGPKPVPVQDIHNTGAHKTLDPRRFGVKPGLISPHAMKRVIQLIKKHLTRLAGHESN